MPSRRQRHFLLRERFDAVADDIDAAFVGGVEFEDGVLVGGAEELPREAVDGGGFANARGAGDDDVWEVAVAGDDLEAGDGGGVADYVVESDGAVFFDPGGEVVLAWFVFVCGFVGVRWEACVPEPERSRKKSHLAMSVVFDKGMTVYRRSKDGKNKVKLRGERVACAKRSSRSRERFAACCSWRSRHADTYL